MSQSTSPSSCAHSEHEDAAEVEFDQFLDSIGWSSRSNRTSSICPAPERPSTPSVHPPKADSAPPSISLSGRVCVALACIGILAAAWSFFPSTRSAVVECFRHFAAVGSGSPSAEEAITEACFRALAPGTRAEEVRNRVGLPWLRTPSAFGPGRQDWHYARKFHGRANQYIVTVEAGAVAQCVEADGLRSSGSLPDRSALQPACVGDLSARLPDRTKRLLRPSDDRAVLLVGPSAAGDPPAGLAFETLRVTEFGAPGDHPTPAPALSLYWRGVVFPLPNAVKGVPSSELSADLAWLGRRLGWGEKG
jgi:hypothetical protein